MRLIRCEVCAGAGWWNSRTGETVFARVVTSRQHLHRCPMCKGQGMREARDE